MFCSFEVKTIVFIREMVSLFLKEYLNNLSNIYNKNLYKSVIFSIRLIGDNSLKLYGNLTVSLCLRHLI